jgi:hypothetical protein
VVRDELIEVSLHPQSLIVFMDLNFNAKLLFSASVEHPGTGDGPTGPNVY